MKIFQSARLKLTVWYLAVIMAVSLLFSLIIYRIISLEIERGLKMVETRGKIAEQLPPRRRLPRRLEPLSPEAIEDLDRIKSRLILRLLIVNGFIFVISAGGGYFLAGETLKPIEEVMKGQRRFVADASHELRTPLTVLKTSTEVVLRKGKTSLKELKKALQSNLQEIDKLQNLTDRLLKLADYQDNSQNLDLKKIDIRKVIQNVYRKILPLAKRKGIKITLRVKKQVIQADQEMLEEMLVIFLDNALKYTSKKGEIIITTQVDKKQLLIKIKDTGIGISQEDMPYIFDRFYRADQSRSQEKISGFGLGLSLAEKIIKAHRGSVRVESKLNQGTTFIVKLPLV